jgi:hypothetical protein
MQENIKETIMSITKSTTIDQITDIIATLIDTLKSKNVI